MMNAVKEASGKNSVIAADRFHVAELYRKGLRKQEMNRLKKELSGKRIRLPDVMSEAGKAKGFGNRSRLFIAGVPCAARISPVSI